MQNRTSSALSKARAKEVLLGYMGDIHEHAEAVQALALEIAELTLSPGGIPDAEDWEMAELVFLSRK